MAAVISRFGTDPLILSKKAYWTDYSATNGLYTFEKGIAFPHLRARPGLKPVFTVDEACPVLSILCHGIEGLTTSFLEMILLADLIRTQLPDTTVSLVVKLHRDDLFETKAWKTMGP